MKLFNIINVFKLHYFLYWGSISAILNFSVLFITEHGGVSQSETGILYCMLPLALVFAKPLFCSIADKYVIHEWVLIISILGTVTFYGLLAILPFLTVKSLIWPLFCCFMLLGQIFSGVLTSITDSMVVKVAETKKTDFGKIRCWGSIGWGLLSLGIGYLNDLKINALPIYVPGILFFVSFEIIDFILMICSIKMIRREIINSNSNKQRRPTLEETIEHSISLQISQSLNHINQSTGTFNIDQEKDISNKQLNECAKRKMEHSKESLEVVKKEKKNSLKFVLLTCYEHPILLRHILIFIVVGMLTALHWNYFPLYLGKLRPKDSNLVGLASVVQTVCGEIPFMYFAKFIHDRIGSKASLNLVLFAFGLRYLLYSFFSSQIAYYILSVEVLHGVTFGLFYYNMNILAGEYSKKMFKVEYNYIMKNVYNSTSNLTVETNLSVTNCSTSIGTYTEFNEDKKQQQQQQAIPDEDDSTIATMQGVMSGAYEGFGVAVGSLISGFGIESVGFKLVWYLSSSLAFIIFILDLIMILIVFLRFRFKK